MTTTPHSTLDEGSTNVDGGGQTIRVDYAGPGGTCEGLRMVGLAERAFGIEWDAAACATRAAAGHLTIRADLSTYRPHHAPGSLAGYWASPPCQTFSAAGKGDGRAQLDRLGETILSERWDDADLFDPRTRHVIDAARNAATLGATWIGMEQVPAVLPLWRALRHVLERHGYSTWCGVLCAADYGVPQTRRRAILMASRERCVGMPTPTHAERPGLFNENPWVSLGEALGWGFEDEPAAVISAGGARTGGAEPFANAGYRRRLAEFVLDRRQQTDGPNGTRVPVPVVTSDRPAPTLTAIAGSKSQWVFHRPATTVCADPRLGNPGHRDREGGEPQFGPDAIRLTVRDALILQSFPADYPVQGTKGKQFEQIGNAVPPLMAAHVAATLAGVDAPAPAAFGTEVSR